MTTVSGSRPHHPAGVDHKLLALASLGGALEIYDFIVFVFFALTLSKVFFPLDMPEWLRLLQSVAIFATGYLARPLGGIVMAHFADRHGRKRIFSLTILLMAMPCLLMGLMPTYAQIGYAAPLLLLVLRVAQGAAVGGEVPSAWTFVAEHARSGRRGYALGCLQAGLTLGYLFGALTATLMVRLFTPEQMIDYAWRIPFVLGGLFGVVGVWVRRRLTETPVFVELQARQESAARFPLREALRGQRRALMPAVLLTAVLTSAVVVLVVVTPTLMQTRFGLSAPLTFALSSIGIVFLNIGCVIAGLAVDRFGAWKAVALYSALMPVGTAALYFSLVAGNGGSMQLALAYAFAGMLSGIVGAVPSVIITLFSTDILVSGISFSYNITYAIWASVAPLALIAASRQTPWACVVFSAIAGGLGLVAAALYGRKTYFGTWRTSREITQALGSAHTVE
ncbi:MFS transporter [Paraburkholderia sp. J67]|uniref:MFS transporter n=1 Tax=Paraburkholderia sp. J67 TaxID=2805435 RepID=UPI002ABE2707|nr:MFS transporter [Paraburkholderia sp. J67]